MGGASRQCAHRFATSKLRVCSAHDKEASVMARGPGIESACASGAEMSRAADGRVFTTAIQAPSWTLKSAGPSNVRPGKNDRSR
jgi:hypothetical protein